MAIIKCPFFGDMIVALRQTGAGCVPMLCAWLLACGSVVAADPGSTISAADRDQPRFVAHAGGRVHGRTYTNSLDALDANYARGFRVFELDFSWTEDGELVPIHDWEGTWARLFQSGGASPTSEAFRTVPMNFGLRRLTVDRLFEWMRAHPEARVVTDVKTRNLDALIVLADAAPDLISRFIPQIHGVQEYESVRGLGFDSVIFTVYATKLDANAIIEFSTRRPLWGLTIPIYRATRGDFAGLLESGAPPIYVHTVNDRSHWLELERAGYYGIYSDDLIE